MSDIRSALEQARRPKEVGRVDLTSDGGEFKSVQTDRPLESHGDWAHVFKQFNLDPDQFVIVDDTVRMSTWQQSSRSTSGDRDLVQLYSYSARFMRKPSDWISAEEIAERQERLRSYQLPAVLPANGHEVAAVVNLSDLQIGKSEGGGIGATLERLEAALEGVVTELDRVSRDREIGELILANNGDPIEGIAGHYASQTYTIEGGLRAQMNLALDVFELWARTLFPMVKRAKFVSVLCNHGEFGRAGGGKKSITSDSDNAGGFLAESLERVLVGRPEFDHVEFVIPHDEMVTYTEAIGVPMAFTHGHKIPGSDAGGFEKWLNGQVRGDRRAHDAAVWVTAHRHNLQLFDLGSATVVQCPSCDGGSKWLRDSSGKYSRSGVVSFLVDPTSPLTVTDLKFYGG